MDTRTTVLHSRYIFGKFFSSCVTLRYTSANANGYNPLPSRPKGATRPTRRTRRLTKLFRFDEGATRELSSNQGALITRSRWRPMRCDPGLATAAAQFRLEFDLHLRLHQQ